MNLFERHPWLALALVFLACRQAFVIVATDKPAGVLPAVFEELVPAIKPARFVPAGAGCVDEVRDRFNPFPDLHLFGKVVGFENLCLFGSKLTARGLGFLGLVKRGAFFQQRVEIIKVFDGGGGDCPGAFCYEFFQIVEVSEWDFPFECLHGSEPFLVVA